MYFIKDGRLFGTEAPKDKTPPIDYGKCEAKEITNKTILIRTLYSNWQIKL